MIMDAPVANLTAHFNRAIALATKKYFHSYNMTNTFEAACSKGASRAHGHTPLLVIKPRTPGPFPT